MSLNEIVKTMQDAVNRQTDQAKPGGYDTTATVRRIEGDTAFVHIPGGVDETPVKLTINAKAGDNVQVRVSGGSAFLVGNGSAPPTDDARANQAYTVATVAEGAAKNALANAARAAEAADSAQASATRAEGAAGAAQTAAGNAQTAADTALVNLATTEDVVGVLNWITAHGTMTTQSGGVFVPGQVYFISDPAGDYVVGGNHYSVVPEPKADDIDSYYILTVNESVQNYVATHIVVDSEGLWIIPDAGGNKVLIATGSGSTYTTAGTYIVGKVGGVDTVLAEFTASGAVIGDAAGAHTSIDEDGMQIYSVDSLDNVVNLANIGYGPGTDQHGSTSYAPYYTFGRRITGSEGNYSIAEGYFSRADGYASHAEGSSNVSSDGFCGHSEGSTTNVLASCGHAEGISSTVRGDYAHAQNNGTYADRRSHTVIGEYNVRDQAGANGTVRGDYAVIVGNGTADNARSNALTVDWSGNVEAAGGIIAVGMVGVMQMFAGPLSATPSGWLFCDGSAVSRTDYSELFDVIGTRFGVGDGSTTFNIPDMRARTPIGLNAASLPNGANSTYSLRSRADTGGAEKVTLTTNEMPSHHHDVTYAQYNRGTGSATASALQYTGYTKQTSSTGGGQAHENMQPFLAVGFIICTGKFA